MIQFRDQPGSSHGMTGNAWAQAQFASTTVHTPRMGPQETADWTVAIDSVVNRLVSIEASLRKHGQNIAEHETKIQGNLERCEYLFAHQKNQDTRTDTIDS